MKVDNVLILAAGKGTRMGEIGKVLPKVIWPIFNKSILELEISYAQTFNPKKVFINLYNSKETILEFSRNKPIFNDVEFLIEKEALDIGGAVHNLASKLNYKGNLLILNSDQFIILSEDKLKEFESTSKSSDATLLVYTVDPNAGYGGLRINNNKAVGLITKEDASHLSSLMTYTGMSLIKLDKLKKKDGKSNFFESVIDFKRINPSTVNVDSCEYWDFGTLKRYTESINALKGSKDHFVEFLKKSGVVFEQSNSKVNSNINITSDSIIFKN
jgi:mannose-1-phosphate guanylyltransferase